jgi:hypothetical protein
MKTSRLVDYASRGAVQHHHPMVRSPTETGEVVHTIKLPTGEPKVHEDAIIER